MEILQLITRTQSVKALGSFCFYKLLFIYKAKVTLYTVNHEYHDTTLFL